MVSVMSLWLPILLSAVIVFVVSSIIHMVLTYHRNDFQKLPREEEIMASLRPYDLPPGEYVAPYAGSMKVMNDPAFVESMKAGPVALMTVMPNGPASIGSSLVQWFLYSILVSIFAAYIAGSALPAGASYLAVFRLAGCAALIGYALALIQNSIWYKRKWSTTLKQIIDGLIYGLMTAGTFGWLWPR